VEAGYTYGYNLLGDPLAFYKLSSGSTPGHSTLYTYDTAGRKQYESNDGRQVNYKFDGNANRIRLTWPDNYYVQYTYDALNRMTYALENGATELAYYDYDPLSKRNYLCLGGQSTACQTVGGGTNKTVYTYENNGDLSSITQVLNGASVKLSYGHNYSHQITSLSATDGFYLPALEQGPTAYSPTVMNRYSSIGGNRAQYDNNGNLQTLFPPEGIQSFTYDSENRLIRAAVGGSPTNSIFYDYDALERRVTKTAGGSALGSGGTTTNYLLDDQEELAELDGAGNVLRRYIPGPSIDDRIAVAEGSSTTAPVRTYFHVNHEGSVQAMTDAAGNASGCAAGVLCQQLGYDDYGNLSSGSSGTGEPYRFTGRRFDAETGMYYYRARYYSPSLGRFMQMDPVGSKDDINLYAYVGNDPLDRTDPTGLATYDYFPDGTIVVTQEFNNHSQFSDSQIQAQSVKYNGSTSDGHKLVVIFTPGTGKDSVNIATNGTLNDTSANASRSHTDKINGRNVEVAPNAVGAITVGHEMGHTLGAGDQYKGGVNANGNTTDENSPSPSSQGSIMRDYGNKPANTQTKDEIERNSSQPNNTVRHCSTSGDSKTCQ
jgi:RHS repeat-associated protein